MEWDVRGVSPEVVAALLGVVGGADREDRQILRTLVVRGVGLGCQV